MPRPGSLGPRRRSRRSRLRRFVGFAGAATATLLVASLALVVPWRWLAPPTTAFVLRARLSGEPVARHWVPLSRISPELAVAVVAAEDQRFAAHHGLDLAAIRDSLREGRSRPRGASTLTQQVAKNLFLWPDRSWVRKGLEAYLALLIDASWPKRRILEVHLNVAEFGSGVFGAGAASERFFAKPAALLTAREAALLAAVLPSPRRMSPARPSVYVEGRADEIEDTVRSLGGVAYLRGVLRTR